MRAISDVYQSLTTVLGFALAICGAISLTLSFSGARSLLGTFQRPLDRFFEDITVPDNALLIRFRIVSSGAIVMGLIWIVFSITR